MGGRNALEYEDINSIVDELLSSPVRQPKPEERMTKRTPHEVGRAARYIPVTFPSAAWKLAIQEECDAQGIRICDFMTYAAAYLMRQLRDGHVLPMDGKLKFYHRSAECFTELPWSPEVNNNNSPDTERD